MKLKDLRGERIGLLTVLERADNIISPSGHSEVMWKCQCDCGNIKIIRAATLRNGQKSCGCLKNNLFQNYNPRKKHGESKTRLYKIWMGMKKRCYQKNSKTYERYGGRGIIICDEWLDFEKFRDWALSHGYNESLSIDRKDVNGNYEPTNCKWSTNKEQANNRRSSRIIEYKGEKKTLAEWADYLNVPYARLQARFDNGWSVQEAFETPQLKARREYGENSIA